MNISQNSDRAAPNDYGSHINNFNFAQKQGFAQNHQPNLANKVNQLIENWGLQAELASALVFIVRSHRKCDGVIVNISVADKELPQVLRIYTSKINKGNDREKAIVNLKTAIICLRLYLKKSKSRSYHQDHFHCDHQDGDEEHVVSFDNAWVPIINALKSLSLDSDQASAVACIGKASVDMRKEDSIEEIKLAIWFLRKKLRQLETQQYSTVQSQHTA